MSHAVAIALRDWLPQVIQQVDPWVSSEDIAKGTRGSDSITKELAGTGQGVVCLTRHNVSEPWINFEAGALSNHASGSRVRTVLFDLEVAQVQGPLSDFQHTNISDKHQVKQFLDSINESCESPLREAQLEKSLDKYWPDLVTELDKIRESPSAERAVSEPRKRTTDEILTEVLERVRMVERDNRRILDELLGNAIGAELSGTRRVTFHPGDFDALGAKYTAMPGLGVGRFRRDSSGKAKTDKEGNVQVNFPGRKGVKVRRLEFMDLPLFETHSDAKDWLEREIAARKFLADESST